MSNPRLVSREMALLSNNRQRTGTLLAAVVLACAAASGARALVLSGSIADIPESSGNWVWGDGANDLCQQWSRADARSGWFYGSESPVSNADIYVYRELADPLGIRDASTFAYTAGNDRAWAGDTVFFRGVNGYYGAWSITSFHDGRLAGRWYFVDDGSSDFSSSLRSAELPMQAGTCGRAQPAPPEHIRLDAADLAAITRIATARHPELADSPGIKWSSASREAQRLSASVIFLPYRESSTTSLSYIVWCERPLESDLWQCDRSKPRSYVALPFQRERVVVLGLVDYDLVLEAVRHSRLVLDGRAGLPGGLDEVAYLHPDYNGHILVAWRDAEDRQVAVELAFDGSAPGEQRFRLIRVE